MARILSLHVLALGVVVLASTPSSDTASPSLWDKPQPSHLPWAWNRTFQATKIAMPTNPTYIDVHKPTYTVNVGDQGKLLFSPSSLNASVGSIIAFNFLALNHTLTQSNLSSPCQYNGGFDSGFRQFNPANVSGKYVIEYEVQREDPQWFFCAQSVKASHCQAGMVFSLNPGGAHPEFLQNARSTVTAKTQPTSACQQLPLDQHSHNATSITATISANIGPSSAVISPPISNSGNRKSMIGLGLVASLYVLFL